MALIHWWMPLVWLAIVGGLVAFLLWRQSKARRRSASPAVPIAHSERLTSLPSYRAALRRYRLLLVAGVVVIGLMIVSAVLLSSRLVSVTSYQPEMRNRDIVLCLDVSGSMIEYDAAIVETFGELVEQFDGERIGLVLFNASAATYFPLTSDYAFVTQQLDRLHKDLSSPTTDGEFVNGTLLGDGSSLIGDGLGSCVMRFDDVESPRSRSIVLATDNYVAGEQIMTLPEAGEYATRRGVVVYGINPGDTGSKDYIAELADEMERVVTETDGAYYALEDPGAVPSIVSSIQQRQTARLTGATQLVRNDEPTWLVVAALAGTTLIMLVGWRLRR
ncbi:VWA domain-containing protein [Okibacterium endophyticum]